ncbi:MAG TPA: T9SS type A sorting domain-containing protein, partial [Chitinophagales bacterium]|nr:T9SS type A sorting domain-containing protein [Chitinophagales bacterium]
QTYRQNGNDFFPGPLNDDGTTDATLCSQFNQMWSVYGTEIAEAIDEWNTINPSGTSNPIPEASLSANVLQWPGKGNPFNTIVGMRNLAPFFDRNADGIYNPTHGDYPILGGCSSPVYADQMIWWVYNDVGNAHSESGGVPLGIEVQALAYAFISSDCINDQTFYRYKIINKSNNEYHDLYAGLWVDPDLGCYTDDFIGCDTLNNMGIIYNADPVDQPCGTGGGYNDQPPLTAVKLLNSLTNDPTQRPMSHFMYFNNDFTATGNPSETHHFYQYLKSVFTDGTHLTTGASGYGGSTLTNYAFPSEPGATGWSECSEANTAADRRIVVSSGPATLSAGQQVTLDYAVVWVQPPVGTYNPCPNYDQLQSCAAAVQTLYDYFLCDNSFVSIQDVEIPDALNVWPNPGLDEVHLNLSSDALVEIFDVNGKMLLSKQIASHSNKLDVSGLAIGCYIVKATKPDGVVLRTKLAVQ